MSANQEQSRKIPIGIDFGTTNTTVCLAAADGTGKFTVECLKFNVTEQGGVDYIPTVVLYDERPLPNGGAKPPLIGNAAMRPLLRDTFEPTTHRLCLHGKFLLGEESRGDAHWQQFLRDNPHYATKDGSLRYDTTAYKPSRVVSDFFKALFEQICAHPSVVAQHQRKLVAMSDLAVVVTCPEAWKHSLGLPLNAQSTENADASTLRQANPHPLLKDILEKRLGLTSVEIKTEPEAATVFFAKQYEDKNAKPYDGRVMIVDYGGGTLDICLSQVERRDDGLVVTPEPGGHHATDGRFVAGVKFDETVFELAWRAVQAEAALGVSMEELKQSANFHLFMDRLDKMKREDWQFTTETLRDHVQQHSTEDSPCFKIPCDWNDRTVKLVATAERLVQAFNQANAPTLLGCLNAFETQLGPKKDRKNLPKDSFRLLLVGGFSRLELARRAVIDYFGWNPDDPKEPRVARFDSDADTAYAIAKGAALLAARWARVEGRMRYSVGVVYYSHTEDADLAYAPALPKGMKYTEAASWHYAGGSEAQFDLRPDSKNLQAYIENSGFPQRFKLNVDAHGNEVEASCMLPNPGNTKIRIKFRYDEQADGVVVRFEEAKNPDKFRDYPIRDLIRHVMEHTPALIKVES